MRPLDRACYWGLSWLLLVVSCAVTVGCRESSNDDFRDKHGASAPRKIVALGRLEPEGGIISISAVPGPGQRLKSLKSNVVEGAVISIPATAVAKPDPRVLGYLASYDISKAQLEALDTKKKLAEKKHVSQRRLAEVQLSQARATLEQARAKQAEIVARKSRLSNLQQAAELARQEYVELELLQAEDFELVTQHQLARQRNRSERAQIECNIANASYGPTVAAAKAAFAAAKKGREVAKEKKNQLKEIGKLELLALDKERELAQKTLAESELRLPDTAGKSAEFTVLKINLRPGEFVTQMPIMLVGDLTKMICIAEVYEADAKEIREGQGVRIFSSAFDDKYARRKKGGRGLLSERPEGGFAQKTPDPFFSDVGGIKGTVKRVGSIITSPGLTNRNPLAPSDRSVVEVLIEIDGKATAEAAKHVQLQVMVEFGAK